MPDDFATRLRNHRQGLNLSQRTLAKMCCISEHDQDAYESGTLHPNRAYLHALADAGLDVGYLTTGEFTPQPPEGMNRGIFIFLTNYRYANPEIKAELRLALMIGAAPRHELYQREATRLRREQSRISANDD